MRSMANVKLYVDVDDDERIIRRILRDTSARSRNLESIVFQYRSTVKPMHHLVVDPTKKYADFILQDVQNIFKTFDDILRRSLRLQDVFFECGADGDAWHIAGVCGNTAVHSVLHDNAFLRQHAEFLCA